MDLEFDVSDFKSERFGLKAKYLLTSYVSTNAIKTSGNAIANDTIAASSPSLDSSVEMSNTPERLLRCFNAVSKRSPDIPEIIGFF